MYNIINIFDKYRGKNIFSMKRTLLTSIQCNKFHMIFFVVNDVLQQLLIWKWRPQYYFIPNTDFDFQIYCIVWYHEHLKLLCYLCLHTSKIRFLT